MDIFGGVSARRTNGSYYEPYESHLFGGYFGPSINPNTVSGMYEMCTVSGVDHMNIVTYRDGSGGDCMIFDFYNMAYFYSDS